MDVRRIAVNAAKGNGKRVVVMMIAAGVSCSSGPEEGGDTYRIGGVGGEYGGVAHARATGRDAGSVGIVDAESVVEPVMPENPAHISLRLAKADRVIVTDQFGEECPYVYEVTQTDNETIVTLYVPQGTQTNVTVAGVDSKGNLMEDPIQVTLEPDSKLGTSELNAGMNNAVLKFRDKDEQVLTLGQNVLQVPVSEEFLTSDLSVLMGVYEAQTDGMCSVSWTGCEKVYAFTDGQPVCHSKPFQIPVNAGQRLGIYPVISTPQDEEVSILLEIPSSACEE